MSAIVFRPARPEDAVAIAGLFRQAYGSGHGAAVEYPYPQLLTPDGVRSLMQQPDLVWRVAEGPHGVLGSFGSILYREAPLVAAAELFGLVVGAEARRQRLGSRLFHDVVATLKAQGAAVILSDTRTRDPGGSSIVRAAGFEPVGFVPAGHRTPGGLEAMLSCAWVHPERLVSTPPPARLPPRASALWHRFERNRNAARSGNPALASRQPLELHGVQAPAPSGETIVLPTQRPTAHAVMAALAQRCRDPQPCIHLPGLGGRAELTDRFVEAAGVASTGGRESGAVVARWDRSDERIRVLEAAAEDAAVWCRLLAWVEAWSNACRQPGHPPPALTLDVRADGFSVLADLERRGYVPTTLHPGLLGGGGAGSRTRIDAFRYELGAAPPGGIPASVQAWPEALVIAQCVVSGGGSGQHDV